MDVSKTKVTSKKYKDLQWLKIKVNDKGQVTIVGNHHKIKLRKH